ncbi:MAG: hypothetical protein JSV64_04570 [Candidatus Bathyarchaeota archaeon]|nr:MAG: hypothetical protein JSV64_04570 [Candidatus Bathyarchaeota archaeon]
MDLSSILEVRSKGMFAFAIFYALTGIMNFSVLVLHGLGLIHVALIGILSLVCSFGLYQLRSWSLWFVAALFFMSTTYGAIMLSTSWSGYSIGADIGSLAGVVVWALYLIFIWVATAYIMARREIMR